MTTHKDQNSEEKKLKALKRRQFLKMAGGAAGLAAGATALGQVVNEPGGDVTNPDTFGEPCDLDLFALRDQGDLMDIMVDVVSEFDRALKESPTIYGDTGALYEAWDRTAMIRAKAAEFYLANPDETHGISYEIEDPDDPTAMVSFPVDTGYMGMPVDQFMANEYTNLANMEGWLGNVGDIGRKLLAKLLGILGVTDFTTAIGELLEKELQDLENAKSMAERAKILKKILKKMMSKKFFKELAEKVGTKAAKRIVGKIALRCLPWIGWAILIAELLWAIGEQIFD